ncbi:hypothetical protein ACFSQD_02155 [Flavihumibacter stibioxidans]|uniref:hypothetical protein n=1 Tax=Flavihumibacter stibioxidans TaxID=1834163 RepID=UPI00164FC963|nr:hypothetical protein [Flavihumibacter stibioxidans]
MKPLIERLHRFVGEYFFCFMGLQEGIEQGEDIGFDFAAQLLDIHDLLTTFGRSYFTGF